MGFFLTPPISVFTKTPFTTTSPPPPPPQKKMAEKVMFFLFQSIFGSYFRYLCPSPKNHRKVPPEEQVAFNVMEAHSTGRLAKGAVGIQGGNR